ncbi:MAG: hypothetical protein AAF292_16665 [Pseudomonadota bacterium]
MSDETGNKPDGTARRNADITDLTAVIARRKARSAASQRPLSERLLAGDAPRTGSHPADAVLRALNTKVEADALNEARAEIDALAKDVKLRAVAGGVSAVETAPPETAQPGFVPSIVPSGSDAPSPAPASGDSWQWLEDVALVATAQNGGKPKIGSQPHKMLGATVPPMETQEAEDVPAAGSLAAWAASNDAFDFEESLPDPEPIRLFDKSKDTRRQPAVIENTPEPRPEVTPVPAAALEKKTWFGMQPGTAFDEGEKHEGLPLWLHLGLPIAAVSAAALAIALHNVTKPDTTAATNADASAPDVSARVETVPPPVPTTEAVDAVEAAPLETETAALPEQVAPPTVAEGPALPEPQQLVDAAETTPAPVTTVSSEGRVNTFISPAVPAPVASAPSAKPASIPTAVAKAPLPSAKPGTRATATSERPSGTVPVQTVSRPIEPGSAASALLGIANEAGTTPLSLVEEQSLARALDKAFDNEIDGRSVSLKSASGDRYRVTFETSYQDAKDYSFDRSRDIASIPNNLVVEGGWFAAKTDARLYATPSIQGAFETEAVSRGTLVERIGTFTDTYGDRWYLVGVDGVAVGYVSPADVVFADLYSGDLGQPLSIAAATDPVKQISRVYTNCRSATIGPEGRYWQVTEACRNPNGHWVSPAAGYVPQNSLVAASGGQDAILLAAAPPQIAPALFEVNEVRELVFNAMPYASDGQTLSRILSDGSNVSFTFGERFQKSRKVSLVRVDSLGEIDRPVKIDARWVQVPDGARMRPTPSYQTAMTLGSIKSGEAVETIATTTSNKGEDWVLVGRNGTGFGWVSTADIAPLSGIAPVKAMPDSYYGRAVMDIVDADIPCRTVGYAMPSAGGSLVACQQPGGDWVFEEAAATGFAAVTPAGNAATTAP